MKYNKMRYACTYLILLQWEIPQAPNKEMNVFFYQGPPNQDQQKKRRASHE